LHATIPHHKFWRIKIKGDYLKVKLPARQKNAPRRIDLSNIEGTAESTVRTCLGEDCERQRERAGRVAWAARGTASAAGQCAPRQPSK